jgi:predicted RNase H-like HicB family nuclease
MDNLKRKPHPGGPGGGRMPKRWPDIPSMGHACSASAARAATSERVSFAQVQQALGLSISPLEARIQVLEELAQQPFTIPIQSLAPSPVAIKSPIRVLVTQDNGDYIASFVDANINGSGESVLEAVEMLREQIAFLFQHYTENESRLGSEPKRQLAVLRDFLSSK